MWGSRALILLAALFFALVVLVSAACDDDDEGRTPADGATPATTAAATPEKTPAVDTYIIPQRDIVDLARRLRGFKGEVPVIVNPIPPNYAADDHRPFYLLQLAPPGQAAEVPPTVIEVWSTLRLVTPHAYFYVQDSESFSQQGLEEAGRIFEEEIYPRVTAAFGKERSPGIDNDEHITILHAALQGAAGYFTDSDAYPRAISPFSNEREMVYIDLPSLQPGSDAYTGILAHELQHLVNQSGDADEELWVNEGLSELAASLVREGSSMADSFLEKPDTQLNTWDPSGDNYAHYGAADLFVRYLAQRAGGTAELPGLVAEPLNGAAGIDAFLRHRGLSFDFFDVFRDWVVTNYLDDGDQGKYHYPELDVTINPTVALTATESGEETVHQFAADYIEVRLSGTDATFTFDGAETVPVLPVEAHGGNGLWWSARADNADTTLTREVDLTGLPRATLRFWTWFDIEHWYDYGYVVVSTDGGETWEVLPGLQMTAENPLQQAYGPGYSGRSGGGQEPVWVEETIDLTPFAGQKVLLRFEYITDGGVNGPGWAIDDIRVPETGFEDDAEYDAGWEPAGFRRVDSPLIQRFLVQLIQFGGETRVRQVMLDNLNRASVRIDDTDEALDAAVVISGLTEGTTESASYQYRMTTSP